MRVKIVKLTFMAIFMAMLSGCAGNTPVQGEGGAMQATGESGLVQNRTSEENGAENAASSDAVSPAPDTVDDLYTREEDILPITQSASAGGISYEIENVEYTESFGSRNRENLNIFTPGADTDSEGNLSEGFRYLFLTITFTNITDQSREIIRTDNDISVIGDSLVTIPWATEACYYDADWTEGTENERHHWVLEPGATVTSEIGWVVGSSGRLMEADPTLEGSMGSMGPYPLYYHVNEYDGSSANGYFIELDVKAE